MTKDEEQALLNLISGSELADLKEQSWFPEVEVGDGEPTDSKFGGTPWMKSGEEWPSCGDCLSVMPLFVQLNSKQLGDQDESGLFQLFHCRTELCEKADEEEEENVNYLVRWIPEAELADGSPEVDASSVETSFSPKRIRSWMEVADYPSYSDPNFCNAIDGWKDSIDTDAQKRGKRLEQYGQLFARHGDKIKGYPAWVQSNYIPQCPRCGKSEKMFFFIQLESEQNIPYQWGDGGAAFVYRCLEHPREFALFWQTH